MENEPHIRYCCCSSTFREKLLELGFVEKDSDYPSLGIKQIRRFVKDNLIVEDSCNGLSLFKIEKIDELKGSNLTKRLKYKGYSVNKELLEHFAKTGIYVK